MEIPLVLSSPRPDRLVYGFPVWYRLVMGAILAIVAAALILGGTAPGFPAWIVLAILVLGALYEDRWTFDKSSDQVSHRAGLIVAAKTRRIDFADIQQFCIVPFVKGTIPGTEDEKAANEAALTGQRTDDAAIKRERHKQPFLSLEVECHDGTRYLIDHMPARKAEQLRGMAARIAEHCGKPVTEA